MFNVLSPMADHLLLFRDELWKERRLLQVIESSTGARLLRKHFDSRVQVEAELRNLELVRAQCYVPAVLADAETHIDLQYIEGARIFRLLEMLRTLEAHLNEARVARQELISRCVATCSSVQRVLADHAQAEDRKYYPVRRKLLALLSVFNHCLALDLNMAGLDAELDEMTRLLERSTHSVPFRDATPKNLILAWPQIWPGRTTTERQRELLCQHIADGSRRQASSLKDAPIFHIDFSSCSEFTVPEDDPVSLLLQEVSWFGVLPSATQLLWLDVEPVPTRLAIAIAVRMYRLGGRRLSYRLLHANGYDARYATESLTFHFKCLLDASESICTELQERFPALLSATRAIVSRLDQGLYTSTDWFEGAYGSQPSRYYRDVYPF